MKMLKVKVYDVLERVLRKLLAPILMIFIGQIDAREQKLFVVDVRVEDQTASVERTATRTSLLEVISRLTGLDSVPRTAEIKRFLSPTSARINYIYRMHPMDKTRYIAVNVFHDTVLNEKKEEFCNVMKSIGCKYITFSEHPEWSVI